MSAKVTNAWACFIPIVKSRDILRQIAQFRLARAAILEKYQRTSPNSSITLS